LRIGNCQIGIKSTNAQFPILNSHPRTPPIRTDLRLLSCGSMLEKIAQSDQLESRLIDFASRIIELAGRLPKDFRARHIANQILRSGTAGAPNYGEARGAESRADFIHKMRIVQKELNETNVWLRIILRSSLLPPELVVDIIAENKELARIASASIKTARTHGAVSDEN